MPNDTIPLEISCLQVQAKLESGGKFLLLDCREVSEYEIVNIADAQLLPMSELLARAEELEVWKEEHVVVHCHHGGRSLQVAAWMRNRGFQNVQSMAGGIHRWAAEIDPDLPQY